MNHLSMLALLIAAPAAAQEAPPPAAPAPTQEPAAEAETETEAGEEAEEEIVVTGSRRQPGAVIGDIPPDQQLGPADIRSYGVNSVADLLAELGPQTRSGRGGPPIVLLNGRRISGFQEIRDLPTEAIVRVDILPEEVALKYGYRADSRVINFVLRRRFRAVTLEADDTIATEGGRHAPEVETDLVSIRSDDRASLHLEYRRETALLESERDIRAGATDDGAATFDQRPFRTLLPEASVFEANAVFARPLLGASASLNGQLEIRSTDGRFGLPVVTLPGDVVRRLEDGFSPLVQRADTINARLGSTVNGDLGDWRWTLTGSYDRNERETLTETGVDASGFAGDPLGPLTAGLFGVFPANRARSVESTGQTDLLVNGTPFSLPAGDVSASVRAGARTTDFTSRSFRNGVTLPSEVERDVGDASVNVDLPIAGREALNALGALSANFNVGLEELSDFGSLVTIGYGLNWRPVDGVRLLASVTEEDNAPSEQQLGAAVVTTPNVRVFDFTRGETATVTTVTGGNPFLAGSDRKVRRLGLTLKPWGETDLDLTANYTDARVNDPTVGFPAATAAIEAAFPDRFGRDAGGRLVSLDTRPINFARTERREMRWGVNFSKPLRSRLQRELEAFRAGKGPNPLAGLRPPGGGQRGEQPGGQPGGQGGGRGFGGGGRGGFGGGQGGGGRLQFALYHNWRFTDRVLVADGGPLLDLLDGDAIGNNGGSARHELEGQAGYTNNGLGARLSVNWRSATRVNGLTTADDLRFGDLGTADLRLFADLGNRPDWVRRHPWMRGVRVTASVDNVFNQRQQVTDATGATPVSLQQDYLDPLGRSVRISVRKLFF